MHSNTTETTFDVFSFSHLPVDQAYFLNSTNFKLRNNLDHFFSSMQYGLQKINTHRNWRKIFLLYVLKNCANEKTLYTHLFECHNFICQETIYFSAFWFICHIKSFEHSLFLARPKHFFFISCHIWININNQTYPLMFSEKKGTILVTQLGKSNVS